MSDRRRTLLLGAAFFGIPIGLDLIAIKTKIGPVLFVLPWAEHAGIHLGDAVCLVVLIPLWCMVTIKLARATRTY